MLAKPILYKIGSVRSSVRSSVRPSFHLPRRFLEIAALVFSKFWYGARNQCEVVRDRAGFSRKICLPQELWKWTKNGPKTFFFFNLLKNFVINFYWICSVIKIYFICCVPVQIPYLGKFLFLRYRPKCSEPIRLQDFLINHISIAN